MNHLPNAEDRMEFVVERIRSMREWRRRTAKPAKLREGRMIIPLPPCISEKQPELLDTLLNGFRHVGGACPRPVTSILGSGPFGAVAARLFAHLTGSVPPRIVPLHTFQARVERYAQSGSSLLICADPSLGEGGLNWLAHGLRGRHQAPGIIYAMNFDGAVMQAVKAAFTPAMPTNADTWLVDAMTCGSSDLSAPGWRATPANLLSVSQTKAALRNTTVPIKAIFTHGNGFDFDLGETVLCGIATDIIPYTDSRAMFPCFHTGTCLRVGQTRLHPDDIYADVLVMAACLGVLDAPTEVDLSVTVFAELTASPHVRSIITTAHFWVAAPEAGLRLLEAIADSHTLGELVSRLNTGLDPFDRSAFLLFGNPEAPTPEPAHLKTRQIDAGTLQAGLTLEPNLHRIAGPAEGARRYLIVLGGEPDPPQVRFAISAGRPDTLLIFNAEPVALHATNPDQNPVPADQIQARAQAFIRACDQLLPAMVNEDVKDQCRTRASDLLHRARAFERAMEERRTGTIEVMHAREFILLRALNADSDQLCYALVKHYRDWSVGGPVARFLTSVWRSTHRQVQLLSGIVCFVCRAPMRKHVYAEIDGNGTRRLTLCPNCSTVADMPNDQAPITTIYSYEEHADRFDLSVGVTNEEPREAQICAVTFLMSRYQVWPESASTVQLQHLAPNETWTMKSVLKKTDLSLAGEHWFALIGLIDGVPFMTTRKILIGSSSAREPTR